MGKNTLKPVFSFILQSCLMTMILFIEMVMTQNVTKVEVNVGVVLDFDRTIGKIGFSCINISLSDFYATHSYYKTRLVLHSRNSKTDVVGAAAAALDLIKNVEVAAIMGPATSMQVNFVIELGEKAQVPIMSFTATSPSLASIRSPYFFRATRGDSCQVKTISAVIQAFGWREAVPVYVDNEFGVGIIPYLTDALQAVDTQVPYRSAIPPLASDAQILQELKNLKERQTRVFVVHMLPSLGSRLFAKAKEIGMMGKGYVWILTDGMTDFLNFQNSSVTDPMEGVLGVKPYVPRTKRVENFRVQWKRKFHQDNPDMVDAKLNVYGLWAYDAARALAMAVEKVVAGNTKIGYQKTDVSGNSTDLETMGVSQIGSKLRQELSNASFRGITGDFLFVNGQLQSSAFQILNVHSGGARRIGFWLPEKGLVKRLKLSATNSSRNGLETIIWPGDTASVPKGWENPTNGKKLRIGVPVKEGFTQFVNVTRDPTTNTYIIKGFSIDLFDAVVAELPYGVPYEYVPFINPDGRSAGSYNDLVYQVYLGNFDAVVGDISIVANRSQYVDFTLPYTGASTISMIVPTTDNESQKAWVFLKPLTWDLWATSLCFFIFIAFVIWVLEHRINDDFQGPPSHQLGTSCWFSFSTMVFSHRERVVSNLGRIVIIIWCFVALILTQSYTASLSSFLTIVQLQPSVTTIDELIEKGENVGYQKGSFAMGILLRLGFDQSKLVPFKSAEECDHLLSKGIKNGGIAAAFDESPSTKLIMAQNCSKYTLVQPTSMLEPHYTSNISNIQEFKTDGRGFVFPKGSPLAPDVSRAILKVIEGEKIKEIEEKWFGKQGICPDKSNSISSYRLGLNSFRGLFLIAGAASFSALLIYISIFMYQNRGVFITSESDSSVWSKILELLRIFKQKDLKSHNSKKGNTSELALPIIVEQSTSTYSIHGGFPEEQRTPSPEHADLNSNRLTPQEGALNVEIIS